jgi:O-antigen ligase/tetratricopeptide (TPR) repeat protein
VAVPAKSLIVDRYVLGGAVVATCVLFTAKAADPVNVIKLTALMLSALGLVASASYRAVRHRVLQVPVGPAGGAALAMLLALAIATSTAPMATPAVLGAYGRNSGLLAYASALVLFVAALRLMQPPHTRMLVGAVVFAGLFTATYGLLQRVGLDAVAWNNPFNPVIAALGNPNFASGYLGIAASVAAGGALWTGWGKPWRALSGVTSATCLLTALVSSSVQGPIAGATGLAVVATARLLETDSKRKGARLAALGGAAIIGLAVLVLGATAKAGPAAAIFTDYGSRARGFYWRAAWEMFEAHPITGVGLDHYGSFWRMHRSPESVSFLGGPSYSDAAHSVPLQMLAQGGLILGLTYLGLVIVVLVSLVRGLVRLRGSERMLLASVGAGWAAYQVQSFVSIDQVPLIVLHFALGGAVVAASGSSGLREVRLPGALKPVQAHPNDAATRRRVAAAAPRRRQVHVGDLVALLAVGMAVLTAAWLSFYPLRANIAVAEGDRQLSRGQGNAALEAYERATGLVPGQPVYWGKQAHLLAEVQQPAQARAAYDQAARRDPYDVNALLNAARVAEQQGDQNAARTHYGRALEVDPLSPETLVAASIYELRHRGAMRAQSILEEAVRQLPSEPTLWATLGDARAVLGDAAAARLAYERALQLQPGQATAAEGLEKLARGA